MSRELRTQENFDRFMIEAPPDLPLSLDGDCYCGGIGDAHKPGCPLDVAKERLANPHD